VPLERGGVLLKGGCMKVTSLVGASLVLGIVRSAGTWAAAADTTGSDAQSDAWTLQEVVVTAERRTTDLQQTAIAATVLSGADLAAKGIVKVDQLQTVMPSVVVQNFGQGNDFNIRGIGKGENNAATTTGVITYRNGVASFPGYFQDEPYFDIASLEVLRGPQGTFAGQNATGGAVFITEANPTLSGVEGYVLGQYGNYNDAMLQGAVNLPVSDTVAARVAFYDERRDSFYDITGPYTGGNGSLKESSARFSLLWQPSDALHVIWKNDYSYIDSGGYPGDPATATNDIFHIAANAEQLAFDQIARSTLNVNYTFGNGMTLRSISGYQWGRTTYDADLDGTDLAPLTFKDAVKERIASQELNLISPDHETVTWVTGLYYQSNNYDYLMEDVGLPPGVFDDVFTGTNLNNTAAAFGQLSFNMPAGVQFQLGLRYSHSDSTNHVTVSVPELGVALPDHQSEHDDKVTGKAALNWTVDPNNFLYAFVATGSKGGGLNLPSTPSVPPAFRAEYVTDYEIGWKATAFDGHLKTQLGGYYNNYKNFQVTIDNPTNPGVTLEVNDPSPSKLYGVEASAQAAVQNFSFDFGTFYANDPRLPPTSLCDPGTGPASTSCTDLSGHPQTYAPTFTFNVGAQYAARLDGANTLTPSVNYSHTGREWATLFDNPALGDHLEDRNLLSAQLAFQHGDWIVTGYGTNLTDQHYVSAIISGIRFAGAPRQYGIRLAKNF
jgi:iron complex outermembrane receptor protein